MSRNRKDDSGQQQRRPAQWEKLESLRHGAANDAAGRQDHDEVKKQHVAAKFGHAKKPVRFDPEEWMLRVRLEKNGDADGSKRQRRDADIAQDAQDGSRRVFRPDQSYNIK